MVQIFAKSSGGGSVRGTVYQGGLCPRLRERMEIHLFFEQGGQFYVITGGQFSVVTTILFIAMFGTLLHYY